MLLIRDATQPTLNMASLLTLAHALGLRPLDRVQLNSQHQLREMRNDAYLGRAHADLPFWFFQRITPDGLLEVMSPGGSTEHVAATDVCDIIRGEPIEVLAMPQKVFIQRLRLPLHERGQPAPQDSFSPAYVRWVRKDRWNRLDKVHVTFHDDALNCSPLFSAPVWAADRDALQARMSRRLMPIVGPGAASYSADQGVSGATASARYAFGALVRCVQQGLDESREQICSSGIKPMTTAQLNRLMDREARSRV